MKKLFAILLTMLLCMPALAFEGSGYPAWDGSTPPANAAGGSFGGESLLMEFDPSAEFSMVYNGLAQLCFFCQTPDQGHYLELYLMLPLDLQSGDLIRESDMGSECSISLYEVSPLSETLYYAGQFLGIPYPENAAFEIRIDSASKSADSYALHGSFSATLQRMEGELPGSGTLHLENVEFDCTLPLSGSAAPNAPASPFGTPEAMPEAAPKFTLPPDYIRL